MSDQRMAVLLIEDNAEDTQVIQAVLTDEPGLSYQLSYAETLASGLKRLQGSRLDLVLLDLNLPDSQGLETLKKIRQQALEVPIVVLTASNEETLATQALKQGAQDYLVKGLMQVYPNLLQRAMRYAMERKRGEATLKQKEELERLNHIMLGREEQILELKKDINRLLKELGRPPKFNA